MAYSGSFHMERERTPQPERPLQPEPPRPRRTPGLSFDLGALFQKTEAAGWETDDLLLALVLYLMYRESGDTDLLIMLAVLLLA